MLGRSILRRYTELSRTPVYHMFKGEYCMTLLLFAVSTAPTVSSIRPLRMTRYHICASSAYHKSSTLGKTLRPHHTCPSRCRCLLVSFLIAFSSPAATQLQRLSLCCYHPLLCCVCCCLTADDAAPAPPLLPPLLVLPLLLLLLTPLLLLLPSFFAITSHLLCSSSSSDLLNMERS
jgi:hypothetical protein